MAQYEMDTLDISMLAAADLSSYQYCFVKITADNTVNVCGDGEQAFGILQNKPTAAGKAARVRVLGVSRLVESETLTAGDKVGSAANGQGKVSAHDTDLYSAICLDGITLATTERATVLLVGPSSISV